MIFIDNEGVSDYEEDATSWIALADMMTGLMAIFLALAVAILVMQQGERDAIILSVSQTIEKKLKEKGVPVNVDKKTGRLILSSDTNFEFGEAVLSDKGRQDLNIVMPIYAQAIFGELNEKELDSIERIIVEGHTDKVGHYAKNMTLSTQRANAIVAYVDSLPEFEHKQAFMHKLTAVGRGENDAIGDENTPNASDRKVMIRIEFKDYHQIDKVKNAIETKLE